MYKVAIGLVGGVGSGKSSSVDAVASVVGPCFTIKMSDLIREDLLATGDPVNRATLRARGNLRRSERRGYWMHMVHDRCCAASQSVVVIDGIRNLDEIVTLKEYAGNKAHIIAFPASPEIRAGRMLGRNRDIDGPDNAEIWQIIEDEMREESPFGLQVAKCILAADHLIDAELPLNEANAAVGYLVDQIWSRLC